MVIVSHIALIILVLGVVCQMLVSFEPTAERQKKTLWSWPAVLVMTALAIVVSFAPEIRANDPKEGSLTILCYIFPFFEIGMKIWKFQ